MGSLIWEVSHQEGSLIFETSQLTAVFIAAGLSMNNAWCQCQSQALHSITPFPCQST